MTRVERRIESVGFQNKFHDFHSINPSGSKEVFLTYPKLEFNAIELGVTEARKEQNTWANYSIVERARFLEVAVRRLLELRAELIDATRLETGKNKKLAEAEFDVAVEFLSSLAGASKFESGKVIPSANRNKIAYSERTPYGLAALIVSFNTPLPNYAWKVGPSFLAGNISILKPSEFTPLSANLFVSAFQNLVPGANPVRLLLGRSDEGKALLKTQLDLVSFTGSYSSGVAVQKALSEKTTKLILELGGSNALIVFADANLDMAVDSAYQSAFSNSGQRCAAASRLIVQKGVVVEFIKSLKQRISETSLGFPTEDGFGPLISDEAFDKVSNCCLEATRKGLEVFQAEAPWKEERLFPPTLILQKLAREDVFNEEVFGPVTSLVTFESEEEALEIAGNSEYTLTAGIWTRDLSRALRVSRGLRVGLVNLNGPTHGAEFQFPFGGVGKSGNGSKEAGIQSLEQYSFIKLTTISTN